VTRDQQLTAVRVPADVDLEDRLAFGLTGKQLLILAAAAVCGYGAYLLLHLMLPAPVAVAATALIAAGGMTLAFVRHDGLAGDQLALAVARHLLAPKHRILAPDGLPQPLPGSPPGTRVAPLDLPVARILRSGLVELTDGTYCLLLTAQGASFALRPPGEQAAFVAAFSRFLNGLHQPVQILIRSEQITLEPHAQHLEDASNGLTGGLRSAAADHAHYLRTLASPDGRALRRRQIVLVLRTRHPEPELAEVALTRTADQAAELLAAAEVQLQPLNGEQAAALLTRALDPPGPVSGSHLEGVIHAAPQPTPTQQPDHRRGPSRPACPRAAHRPRPGR